jgi:hypothetical protein
MTDPKPDVELRHYAGYEFSAIRHIAIDLYREAFGHEIDKPFGQWNGTVNASNDTPLCQGSALLSPTLTRNP